MFSDCAEARRINSDLAIYIFKRSANESLFIGGNIRQLIKRKIFKNVLHVGFKSDILNI